MDVDEWSLANEEQPEAEPSVCRFLLRGFRVGVSPGRAELAVRFVGTADNSIRGDRPGLCC